MVLYIEQTNDNIVYKIQLQQSQDESKEKPATNLPLPGESAESNIPLAFEGETKTFDIKWTMYNNGEDKAKVLGYNNDNSTAANPIDTLMRQKQWLEQNIHKENLGIKWTLHDSSYTITTVDTSNNWFKVDYDKSGVLESGDLITINGSTGNDGQYTVSSVNYDSTNDETQINVEEDVTDSTADGEIYNGRRLLYKSWNVHLESVDFNRNKDSPFTLEGTMRLKVGTGV